MAVRSVQRLGWTGDATSPVDAHKSGNSSALPGAVTYVCPDGDVQITVKQDPAIIGGLVIRIGDRVIDGSVRTRLQELQAALA